MADPDYGTFDEVFTDDVEEEALSEDELNEDETEEETEEGEEKTQEEDANEEESEEESEEEEGDDEGDEGDEEDGDEGDEGEASPDDEIPAAQRTVTINGREEVWTQEQLRSRAQMASASNEKFREAAQIRKEAEIFYQTMLKDPGAALVDMVATKMTGGDRILAREHVRQSMVDFLEPDIRESMIEDPEDRARHRRDRELKERDEELQRREDKQRREAQDRAEREFVAEVGKTVSAAFKESGLPTDSRALYDRVGELLDTYRAGGMGNEELMSYIPRAVKMAAEERIERTRELAKTLSADELQALFPEQAEALRREKVARVKKRRSSKKKTTTARRKRKEPEIMTTREAFG